MDKQEIIMSSEIAQPQKDSHVISLKKKKKDDFIEVENRNDSYQRLGEKVGRESSDVLFHSRVTIIKNNTRNIAKS
jgi:hypothetical protein